jgi:DNA invertase Pin-like site-specific DNA recombinase
VFEDRASGARADRPGLQKALEYVREGDALIVWKLDRLGRSLLHLIETVTTLEKRGVGFRSVTEAIDTTDRRIIWKHQACRRRADRGAARSQCLSLDA